MGKVAKGLCLLLIITLATLSLLAIQPTSGQSIPKPSVPEFTVKLSNSNPDLERFTVAMTIKNQPVATQWEDIFSYNVRVKSHSSQNWTVFWFPGVGPKQSGTGYTKLSYQVYTSSTQINISSNIWGPGFIWGLERNSPIDFQVQAIIGYSTSNAFPGAGQPEYHYYSAESDWSMTQTITIPAGNYSPSPSPTVPELSGYALLPLCLIVLCVALVLKRQL